MFDVTITEEEDMGDKELLERAAKAAKMDVRMRYCDAWSGMALYTLQDGYFGPTWNPLRDDGDALRLAVKLMMSVEISEHEESTYAYAGKVPRAYACEMWRDDKDAATRRAIVRAAAEIGKGVVTPNASLRGAEPALPAERPSRSES